MDYVLPLLLDGPLQSWGYGSRFMRRTTGLFPTKSGVIGLVAAAMGLAKGSPGEEVKLPQLASLKMTVLVLPRSRPGLREPDLNDPSHWLEPRRLEDYHTVAFTREANAPPKRIAELEDKCSRPISPKDRSREIKPTHRQYLVDARFGVILQGPQPLLIEVAAAVQDPLWGVWLGRKNCIPAKPLFVGGPFQESNDAWAALRDKAALPPQSRQVQFTQIVEAEDGTESFTDQPVSYGNGRSSGLDFRRFAMRRVRLAAGKVATSARPTKPQ